MSGLKAWRQKTGAGGKRGACTYLGGCVTRTCALVKTREAVARGAERSWARRCLPPKGCVDLLPHQARPLHHVPDGHAAGWLQWTSKS